MDFSAIFVLSPLFFFKKNQTICNTCIHFSVKKIGRAGTCTILCKIYNNKSLSFFLNLQFSSYRKLNYIVTDCAKKVIQIFCFFDAIFLMQYLPNFSKIEEKLIRVLG